MNLSIFEINIFEKVILNYKFYHPIIIFYEFHIWKFYYLYF